MERGRKTDMGSWWEAVAVGQQGLDYEQPSVACKVEKRFL